MTRIDEQVANILKELGDNAETWAKSLELVGITGKCFDPTCCPIANYLKRMLPAYHFEVTSLSITMKCVTHWELEEKFAGECFPPTLRDFVNRFDNGEFPKLEVYYG